MLKSKLKIKNKIVYLFAITLVISSCSLIDEVEDVDPGFLVQTDGFIVDQNSAEVALTGVYAALKSWDLRGFNTMHAAAGIDGIGTASTVREFYTNDITNNNRTLEGIYVDYYATIQNANLAIKGISALTDDVMPAADRNAYLGELRYLRAATHFFLLKTWGTYYDTTSPNGIALRLEPAASGEAFPRNTVAEVYASVIEDLQFAIDNAPNLTSTIRVSNEAAQAFMAKALLYSGDYAGAAAMANTVITTSSRSFDADFQSIFDNAPSGAASGVFFGLYADGSESGIGDFDNFGTYYTSVVDAADVRGFSEKQSATDFVTWITTNRTRIHTRLAEMYLIHAEAKARTGSGVDADALASLNAVRTRAAVGLPALVDGVDVNTKAELLEAIRLERLFELAGENGETFSDLGRYLNAGDLTMADITAMKATLDDQYKLIFPIPQSELRGSIGVIEQNEGYEGL